MSSLPQSPARAWFGTHDGRLLCGEGPFEDCAEPPVEGVAFYWNDFGLTESRPWHVPATVREIDRADLGAELVGIQAEWQPLKAMAFANVFREVSEAIAKGTIDKCVPVVTERGVLVGSAEGLGARLLQTVKDSPTPLRPYGVEGANGGFFGLTPEVLFSSSGMHLDTMALAGTANRFEREVFAEDDKEIREHEFVAQTLIAKLSDLGVVTRQPRGILDLGRLLHFQTLIGVDFFRDEEAGQLVRRLHPTPALGPLPRTEETMARLGHWRGELECPPWFGAPFGLWRQGHFEALVGIRGIGWQGNELFLPSGCGVIAESRLMNEWRELRLKRESVKSLFFG